MYFGTEASLSFPHPHLALGSSVNLISLQILKERLQHKVVLRTRNSTIGFAPFFISPKAGDCLQGHHKPLPTPHRFSVIAHTELCLDALLKKEKVHIYAHKTPHLPPLPAKTVKSCRWDYLGPSLGWGLWQAGWGGALLNRAPEPALQCGAEQFPVSVSTAGTPVWLTLGFPPGHGKEGRTRKEVYYGWSLLFQRADQRSTKFHCKGMHFKGEFKTNKILSALTTKLKRGSSRIILCTYYCNILWHFN